MNSYLNNFWLTMQYSKDGPWRQDKMCNSYLAQHSHMCDLWLLLFLSLFLNSNKVLYFYFILLFWLWKCWPFHSPQTFSLILTSEKKKKTKKHLNQKSHKQPEHSPVTVTAYEYPQDVHHVGRGKVQKESTSNNVMFQHSDIS